MPSPQPGTSPGSVKGKAIFIAKTAIHAPYLMLAVGMARLLPLRVDQIRDDVLLPPPHQALPDLSLTTE